MILRKLRKMFKRRQLTIVIFKGETKQNREFFDKHIVKLLRNGENVFLTTSKPVEILQVKL